ncbi:tetratricopeptide repeat protein [Phenylobacterium sp. LjRoot225]|uniref:tetratricopeptide repeat protein n=1 Tax=Phenylobacterium sp. LjRoot225 TaxID=3342285 RepID=UPI003ECDCB3E
MRKVAALITAGLVAGAAGSALAMGGGMSAAPSVSAPAYDPAADYARGVAALKSGQYKDASRSLKRVVRAVPSNVEAWRLLGEACAGDGDWKGSRRAYEQAVKLAPDDVAAHTGLGVALARTQDAKAKTELDWLNAKAQACGESCPDAAALKAGAAAVQGALAGAPAAKPQARLQGSMIFAGAAAGDLAYSAAVSLINEHRYDDALAALTQARAVFGPHPDILTYEGYAWRKKGEFDRAETYYRQALAIAPRHRGASEYYGELKVERGDMAGAKRMLARLDTICAYGCAEAEELRRWIDHRGDPQLR